MEKIMYEVEKSTDKSGGKYFKTIEEAVQYYNNQIESCLREKKEPTVTDFDIFNYIQIVEHKNEEAEILLQQFL